MTKRTISMEIKGRVQGVAFRHHTKKQADKLGIEGFVRNRPDGSVYVEACADTEPLELFILWCKRGPMLAGVTDVIIMDISPKEWKGFSIKY